MTQSPPKGAQNSQREVPARNFQSFAQQMRGHLSKMNPSDRNALLKEFYHLARNKTVQEKRVAGERKQANSAALFRKYRLWLVDVEKGLSNAKQTLLEVATFDLSKVKQEKIDLDENYARSKQVEKVVVRETLNAIAHSVNEIENVIAHVELAQYSLAAVVNPKQPRTRAEKKLVPEEPEDLVHNLLLGEKTKKIDSDFKKQAASILTRYRTKHGKKISNYHRIIAAIFLIAFGQTITAGSIEKHLSPKRRKQSRFPLK
jgi:hypothetical protein